MSPVPPMTPADCGMQGYPRMMVDIGRLRSSAFDATPDDAVWRAGFNLWMSAWQQTPAGSLPDDDLELVKAASLGRDMRTWGKVKAGALRGWVKCSDGRLYHPVVCEAVLECWLDKLARQLASGAGNAKRWGVVFDPETVKADFRVAAEMLRTINPKSEVLKRKPVVALTGVPTVSASDPAGMPAKSRRDRGKVPPGSQWNGIGRKDGPNGPILSTDERERATPDGRASLVWSGPPEVLEAVVAHKGEDWARDFFAATSWRDLPDKAVVCRSGALEQEIKRSCTRLLSGLGVAIVREDAA